MRLPNAQLSLQLLSPAIAQEFGMYRRKIEETLNYLQRTWSSGPALEILRQLQELELDHAAGVKRIVAHLQASLGLVREVLQHRQIGRAHV